MLDVAEALDIARRNFPRGPEALAEALGVKVESTALDGCEGWCVRGPTRIIARINSASPPTRQRFTLAHELAHIICGSPPDVSFFGDACEGQGEEQIASYVASQLLLPSEELQKRVRSLPIDKATWSSISNDANISPEVVARRIVSRKGELCAGGICVRDGIVAAFHEQRLRYTYPVGACPEWRVVKLLKEAEESQGEHRYNRQGRSNSATTLSMGPWTLLLVQSCG